MYLTSSIRKILPLLFLLMTIQSCKVMLVPPQDPELINQIDTVSRDIDTFYLQMLENPGSQYEFYAARYIDIEVQLNAIYDKSRLKAKNVETAQIAKNVRDTWAKYKAEHKETRTLNSGVITYNHTTMDDFIFALSVAENAKSK